MIKHPQENSQNNLDSHSWATRRTKIDEILKKYPCLINDWETRFLRSIRGQCYLSVLQADKYNAILERCEGEVIYQQTFTSIPKLINKRLVEFLAQE